MPEEREHAAGRRPSLTLPAAIHQVWLAFCKWVVERFDKGKGVWHAVMMSRGDTLASVDCAHVLSPCKSVAFTFACVCHHTMNTNGAYVAERVSRTRQIRCEGISRWWPERGEPGLWEIVLTESSFSITHPRW